MSTYAQFVAEWVTPGNKRVGDDSLVGNGETNATKYQCVSLIKQYLAECYGIQAGFWGNAIDYWTHTNAVLASWRVSTNTPQQGDIVVLNGLNGNPYGHITIATGVIAGNTYQAIEQNGQTGNGTGIGGDAIRTRYIDRGRIAGVLRAAAATPATPFTTENIPAKTVRLKQTTHKWNLDYPDYSGMSAHPITTDPVGTVVTVVAIAHHQNGSQYYMQDPGYHGGYNVVDCEDYTPPPPIPATTYEELSKSRDMHVSRAGGAEKWCFDGIASWASIRSVEHKPENYNTTIVAIAHVAVPTAKGYDMAAYYMEAVDYDMSNHRPNSKVGFSYVDVADGLYQPPVAAPKPAPAPAPAPVVSNVSQNPVTPLPAASAAVAAPAPPVIGNKWKTTQQQVTNPKTGQKGPCQYKAKKDHLSATGNGIKDFDGKRPDHDLKAGQLVSIYSIFAYSNVIYGRPEASMLSGSWFGIPMEDLEYVGDDLTDNELMDKLKKVGYAQEPNVSELFTISLGLFKSLLSKIGKK